MSRKEGFHYSLAQFCAAPSPDFLYLRYQHLSPLSVYLCTMVLFRCGLYPLWSSAIPCVQQYTGLLCLDDRFFLGIVWLQISVNVFIVYSVSSSWPFFYLLPKVLLLFASRDSLLSLHPFFNQLALYLVVVVVVVVLHSSLSLFGIWY